MVLVLNPVKFEQILNDFDPNGFELSNGFDLQSWKSQPIAKHLWSCVFQTAAQRFWSRVFENSTNCQRRLGSGLEKSDQVPNGFGQDSWAVQRVSQHF